MADDKRWPTFDWNAQGKQLAWLLDRIAFIAHSARAFELAVDEAAEARELALSLADDALAAWERHSLDLWSYARQAAAKELTAQAVATHAVALEQIYGALIGSRQRVLEELGRGASKVVAREARRIPTVEELRARIDELFGAQVTPHLPKRDSYSPIPVTADELKLRISAESRPLPEPATFRALVGVLPPPWVDALFQTHGFKLSDSDDDDGVELTANSRSTMQKKILAERMDDELLRRAARALPDEDRRIVDALIAAGGSMRYGDATAQFGNDDADGYQWAGRPPSGPLARVRRAGLAFVGVRAGKQLLVVPIDFIPTLTSL